MYRNTPQILQDTHWLRKIDTQNFSEFTRMIFQYQYTQNAVYHDFVKALGLDISRIREPEQIPFLPISLFKTHAVICGDVIPERYFESSGTSGMQNSRHYVKRPELYRESFMTAFQQFYGSPQDYIFLCLLPAYLERKNSSLVVMAETLIRESGHPQSGFYLYDWEKLAAVLQQNHDRKVFLLGVTFALLDFAEAYPMQLRNTIVMETGGMKGRREEWTREQVYEYLRNQWHLDHIHAEYGMTELFSQAYSLGEGRFAAPPWMKVYVRDEQDPLAFSTSGRGVLNIIDLANADTCSFIATDDIGKIYPDGSFEVLGRLDHSALRGCSLMVL